MNEEKTYTIVEAADVVGVSTATLRAWERRYGLLAPQRTAGGHRRYTENDVDRLRTFVEMTRRRRAGNAAQMLADMDRGR